MGWAGSQIATAPDGNRSFGVRASRPHNPELQVLHRSARHSALPSTPPLAPKAPSSPHPSPQDGFPSRNPRTISPAASGVPAGNPWCSPLHSARRAPRYPADHAHARGCARSEPAPRREVSRENSIFPGGPITSSLVSPVENFTPSRRSTLRSGSIPPLNQAAPAPPRPPITVPSPWVRPPVEISTTAPPAAPVAAATRVS